MKTNNNPPQLYENIGIPPIQEQQKRSKQGAIDICMKHFGFYTDPRYSIKQNIKHLVTTTDPMNFPRKPKNLKIHNLCTDPNALTKDILETIGLNLGHGIALPMQPTNPIDFHRLRRTIRLKYVPFPTEDPNDEYNPKLKVASLWEPPPAPTEVENAIDLFEKTTNAAFNTCRKKTSHYKFEKKYHCSIEKTEKRPKIHHHRRR